MSRTLWWSCLAVGLGLTVACNPGYSGTRQRDGVGGGDGGVLLPDGNVVACDGLDSDADGIADLIEGGRDTDGDGTPDNLDTDSDADGISDADESAITGEPCRPRNSDEDTAPNYRDLDSDNDGLTDAEELARGLDPRNPDSDGDLIDDLTEVAAGSNPMDTTSVPPEGTLYVILPYYPPGTDGPHEMRTFDFSTRVKAADIVFLVDTTGSMAGTISSVQTNLSSTIIPGIATALAGGNARYALAAHGDFADGGDNHDGALTIYANLTPDAAAVQAATGSLHAAAGGDTPESQVPAMHALIEGTAHPGYQGGSGTPTGAPPSIAAPKTPTRHVVETSDCEIGPDDPPAFGWACFSQGRLPIVVLMSDAPMNNGPGSGQRYGSVPGTPLYADMVAQFNLREAVFVGVSVGYQGGTAEYTDLATMTNSLRGDGTPLVFSGDQADTANLVVQAITEIIGRSRQDVTTRTDPDATETRLEPPHTTKDFIRSVTPLRGTPAAPAGFDSMDATTFYGVNPDTIVTFNVDFYNDFEMPTEVAQVFKARIVTLGRAGSEVDSRDVFMVVPADGGYVPVM